MWTGINVVYQAESYAGIVIVCIIVCSKVNFHLAACRGNHTKTSTSTKSTPPKKLKISFEADNFK